MFLKTDNQNKENTKELEAKKEIYFQEIIHLQISIAPLKGVNSSLNRHRLDGTPMCGDVIFYINKDYATFKSFIFLKKFLEKCYGNFENHSKEHNKTKV